MYANERIRKSKTYATTGVKVEWHQIDWIKANSNVRKLQARIVKATQEKDWRRVKALQWLLTHSQSGKATAVKRVTENQGKNTPGVDGETWNTPEAKSAAVNSFRRRGYKTSPLRRVYIPKSNGKLRPLGIPTMKDRAMQALHLLALDPVSESISDGHSYGFRKERSAHDAIAQCFNIGCNASGPKTSAQWVLEADIKGCFDNISHEWLLTNVPMDKVVLKKWLKSGFMEKSAWFETESGTPQGGIISPVLANLALNGLQGHLAQSFPNPFRLKKAKVNFVRYADDFVISGVSRELLEYAVAPRVAQFLAVRGLELSLEKTKITHITEGYDFLGQNIRRYGRKLLIKPSKQNVKTFLQKARGTIRELRNAPQPAVISRLNPMIKGWAEYHKHIVAKRTFSSVDHKIWCAIWRWCSCRHPTKGKQWIKDNYFLPKTWDFAAYEREPKAGTKRLLKLHRASDIKINRHVKIRSSANPYDPKDEMYFESRLRLKMLKSLLGRRKLHSIWSMQDGKCLNCNEPLTKESGFHLHHLEERHKGGSDNQTNLIMLHVNCHRQVHVQGTKLEKPVLRKRKT